MSLPDGKEGKKREIEPKFSDLLLAWIIKTSKDQVYRSQKLSHCVYTFWLYAHFIY